MNLLEHYVTKIIGPSYTEYGKFWLPVEYDCQGRKRTGNLMFDSMEELEKVDIGYEL